jgi:outer membrane protein
MRPFPTHACSARPRLRGVLLCLALCAGSASAQEDERSWNLGLALGYGERSNPLISGESIDINAVFDFSWYGERFFVDNGDFGFLLAEHRNYSLNLVATVNNERNFYNYLTGSSFGLQDLVKITRAVLPPSFVAGEDIVSSVATEQSFLASAGAPRGSNLAYVNANAELADRDTAVNGGLEFLHISRWGDIQAQVLTDVSSTHEGQEAWLSWSHPWYTRNNEFTLTLGAEWKSGNLVSYYYGVLPDEAFVGRAAYDAGSGTNTFVRFAARHAFSPHWHLVGMLEREFLSSAISNSPIVDDDEVDTFFAGLLYQF